jgi:hypothetical protein
MNVKKDLFNDMKSHDTVSACLRFSPIIKDKNFDHAINMGYTASFTNTEPVAQSDVTAAKEAAVAASEKINDPEFEGGPITEWLNKKVKKLDNFANKADKKVDHLLDVGPGGVAVEAIDDAKGGKLKDNKVVNFVRDISDWAQS